MKDTKDFKVIARSENTNSFGLYQMVLVSRDGEAYKTHASMYNVKDEGDIMVQMLDLDENGEKISGFFYGTEMTEQLPKVPNGVLNEIFKR